MGINESDLNRLYSWYQSYCQTKKFDSDLFDIKAEIDSSLTYLENQNQIKDKLEPFIYSDHKLTAEERKALKSQLKGNIEPTKINVPKNVQEMFLKMFNKPKVIGLCSDANQGKSNLIYYMLYSLKQKGTFNLYTYGLRNKIEGAIEVFSVKELEQIRNSIIFIDEFFSLFDLDNRKVKQQIENTLRMLFHNNNVILLSGLGDNFKKFISSRLDIMIFKATTLSTLINGSAIKNQIMSYKGSEMGSEYLNIPIHEALIYDGKHWTRLDIPLYEKYDTKAKNQEIIRVRT